MESLFKGLLSKVEMEDARKLFSLSVRYVGSNASHQVFETSRLPVPGKSIEVLGQKSSNNVPGDWNN